MFAVRLAERLGRPAVLAVPVRAPHGDAESRQSPAAQEDAEPDTGELAVAATSLPPYLAEVAPEFLTETEHTGAAGTVHWLPTPGRPIRRTAFVGIGAEGGAELGADLAGWRKAGAAVARGAASRTSAAVLVPDDAAPDQVAALTEGLLLGGYRYRMASEPDESDKLRTVTIVVADADRYAEAYRRGSIAAEVTCLARDLTNQPSSVKTPARLARAIVRAAEPHGVRTRVREPEQLRREGFGGILAVGRGSAHGPRLVELRWRPRGASRHVVLVGKGITFDTGGVNLKPAEQMLIMRKDMGGAATVAAAVIGAARLGLPVQVTALVPLAENALGGDSYRPGDVIRHYGGVSTEVLNTDAEGRMVMADALAYAARRLAPDVLLDFATLTGAARLALGRRTAPVFTDDDALAGALTAAGQTAGERLWRMPLVREYRELLDSDVADLFNTARGMDSAGSAITAALFLREFAADAADRWAHVDMSATSWAENPDAELTKYATGWGVRTLLNYLHTLT